MTTATEPTMTKKFDNANQVKDKPSKKPSTVSKEDVALEEKNKSPINPYAFVPRPKRLDWDS